MPPPGRAGRFPCPFLYGQARTVIVQFSSVAQSYATLCNPMDCSALDFPVTLLGKTIFGSQDNAGLSFEKVAFA